MSDTLFFHETRYPCMILLAPGIQVVYGPVDIHFTGNDALELEEELTDSIRDGWNYNDMFGLLLAEGSNKYRSVALVGWTLHITPRHIELTVKGEVE